MFWDGEPISSRTGSCKTSYARNERSLNMQARCKISFGLDKIGWSTDEIIINKMYA